LAIWEDPSDQGRDGGAIMGFTEAVYSFGAYSNESGEDLWPCI